MVTVIGLMWSDDSERMCPSGHRHLLVLPRRRVTHDHDPGWGRVSVERAC
jgi:hypothetical protein